MEFEENGGMSVATEAPILNAAEIDAIGEVLNISMGSAATAVSTMLDRHVNITVPHVVVEEFSQIDFTSLEPAIIVKIEYVEGISGSNVMVLRQSDMQVILNLLMGNDEPPSPDFVFDELSMSAACEVMNQMMGASATALSSFLGKSINISTPVAEILSPENTFRQAMGVSDSEKVVAVSFSLNIEGIMSSDFISVMTCPLAKSIVNQMMGDQQAEIKQLEELSPAQPPQAQQAPGGMQQIPLGQSYGADPQQPGMPQPPMGQPGYPQQPGMPPMGYPDPQQGGGYPPQPGYPPQQGYYDPQQAMGQQGYPPPPYGYPPYGYPPQGYGAPGMNPVIKQPIPVQQAQFPSFGGDPVLSAPITSANMDLVMNVPLCVSVEIGKTKRKIRDIMDFAQGTVIELEKQAGAPVDIVVNGQLIARGDVVVIDDNFGVRITEILGTKNLVAQNHNG